MIKELSEDRMDSRGWTAFPRPWTGRINVEWLYWKPSMDSVQPQSNKASLAQKQTHGPEE
jgi:hypothetical protein